MRVFDLIQKKRDKQRLRSDEIQYLIQGFTRGDIPDYQMSAFAMAVFFNGMESGELAEFTLAMRNSGITVDLSHIGKPCIDKHSTGGVGDKVSLPLAPAVAACGVPVPMISGRSLGHTGGTLDKLESIPGFKTNISVEEYKRLVKEIGCCLIGQTADIAPADKKLYALRDVTATVECIELVASSIMSKKLAEGIDGLVLDVKFGSGAFIKDPKRSRILAETMVSIGTHMGKRVVAQMTSMDQPLGQYAGNALEIVETLDVLEGKGPADTRELTVQFGAEMLVLGSAAKDIEEGRCKIEEVLNNGQAKAKFAQIIEAQGGDPRIVDNRQLLPTTTQRIEFKATRSGYISAMNTEDIGVALLLLGGGRMKTTDAIDPRVGIEMCTRIGNFVQAGEPLCILHTTNKGEEQALQRLKNAFIFSDNKIAANKLYGPRITALDLSSP